jgi:predicted nucleic acid-binding protein
LTLIVDSYAWIALFTETRGRRRVSREIEGAANVLTPDIVLAEVARKLARDGIDDEVVLSKLEEIATLSTIAPISSRVAVRVHSADVELRGRAKSSGLDSPGLTDAIILALARTESGKVLTGDPHFRGLPETNWLESS